MRFKNSTRSRLQGRNADNPSNWITSEWPTIREIISRGGVELVRLMDHCQRKHVCRYRENEASGSLTKAKARLPIAYQISELTTRLLCQVIRRRTTKPVNQSMRPIAAHPAILRTSLRGIMKDPIAAITMMAPVQ